MILLSGAFDDLILPYLSRVCMSKSIACIGAIYDDGINVPKVKWDIEDNKLYINEKPIEPIGAFIRNSTTTAKGRKEGLNYTKAENWYMFFRSWVAAHPNIRQLNRPIAFAMTPKALVLSLANEAGLKIPETFVTNRSLYFQPQDHENYILKPLMGGSHTQLFSDLPENIKTQDWHYPNIIQEKLFSPDLRIYRIHETWLAFEIQSENLDYRVNNQLQVTEVEPPSDLVAGLKELTDRLGMNYTAADFKKHKNGDYRFLEVNSSPMFEYFDIVCAGKISTAIIAYLMGEG